LETTERRMVAITFNSSPHLLAMAASDGKDVTDRRKLEVTQNLKVYELYAQAAKKRNPTDPSG
jgi:hypothetical protein